MNKYQFRAIRNSKQRDNCDYYNEIFSCPLVNKKVNEIKCIKNNKIFKEEPSYILTKGNNTYKLYWLDFNSSCETLYIITKNDIIIYWITNSIFAPASAAWEILTGTYHGYNDKTCWRWKSVDDFDCIDIFLTKSYNEDEIQKKKYNFDYFRWYHVDEQIKRWNEEKKYYIDKEIITKEEEIEILSKEYYHI